MVTIALAISTVYCVALTLIIGLLARQHRRLATRIDHMQEYIGEMADAGNTLTYGINAMPPLAPETPDSSGWSESAKWEYDISKAIDGWKEIVEAAGETSW